MIRVVSEDFFCAPTMVAVPVVASHARLRSAW